MAIAKKLFLTPIIEIAGFAKEARDFLNQIKSIGPALSDEANNNYVNAKNALTEFENARLEAFKGATADANAAVSSVIWGGDYGVVKGIVNAPLPLSELAQNLNQSTIEQLQGLALR